MKKISFVVPVYNEMHNIPLLYEKIVHLMQQFEENWTLLFVNDGSCDDSLNVIKSHANNDNKHIQYINLSRNFGHQAALTAGLNAVKDADAVISMDCDLQDPPEVIAEMIKKWHLGYDIVYARRKTRQDNFFKKYTAIFYYKLLDRFSDVKIPRNVGDFRLIDKKVLKSLSGMEEKSRYLRGMIAWLGYKHTFVDFDRPERIHGETGYSYQKMFKLAMDGVLSFSFLPLRIGLALGIISIALGSLMLSYMFVDALVYDVPYPLFKWLVVVLLIFVGFLFMLMWILGEYIGRIYDETRKRPLYIIDDDNNFK
jgi:dolichol-phosphate mannosyltransferase